MDIAEDGGEIMAMVLLIIGVSKVMLGLLEIGFETKSMGKRKVRFWLFGG